MKKSLITLLILICFTGFLHAKEKYNYVYIKQYDKVIGKFTPEQYESLVKGADNYKELMLAQNENRVSIILIEEVKETLTNQYKGKIKIVWKDAKGNEINYLISEINFQITNKGDAVVPEWRIIYRDISEIGFPVTTGILIIILLILI